MKFFLDSANLDEIREGLALGIEGVTTNPTSMAKEIWNGVSFLGHVKSICSLDYIRDVSVQITEQGDYERIANAGMDIKGINNQRIILKVPCTVEVIKACRLLSLAGARVNVTLVFSPVQALFAAKAGAYIVSPFLARTDDAQYPGAGFKLIRDIRKIYDYGGYKTQILAASIRSVDHVMQAALAGAHICTMSLKVLKEVHAAISHPQTEDGLAKMLADWNAAQPAAWDTQTR